jgi:hypothetical protein
MFISQIPHSLDETINIPKQMPKEVRELASFLALVVDATTKNTPFTLMQTDIKCFEKGCQGFIKSEIIGKKDDIHWRCSKCENEGVISEWQGMKWDNRRNK